MKNLRMAYMQADLFWNDIDKNLARFTERFQNLKETVDLIVLPEMFNTAFSTTIDEHAEPMNGKSMQWMAKMAKEKNAIVASSLVIAENGKMTNRFIWMKPDGTSKYYDKKHLFLLSREAQVLEKGTELKTFELNGWKIRPFICYDLRFPCWIRNRLVEGKHAYDLGILIASWPVQRCMAWRAMVPARAVENQAYFLGLNRVGVDGVGDIHIGDSMVVNYAGEYLSTVPQGADTTAIVELDYEKLTTFRKNFKVAYDWDSFESLPK